MTNVPYNFFHACALQTFELLLFSCEQVFSKNGKWAFITKTEIALSDFKRQHTVGQLRYKSAILFAISLSVMTTVYKLSRLTMHPDATYDLILLRLSIWLASRQFWDFVLMAFMRLKPHSQSVSDAWSVPNTSSRRDGMSWFDMHCKITNLSSNVLIILALIFSQTRNRKSQYWGTICSHALFVSSKKQWYLLKTLFSFHHYLEQLSLKEQSYRIQFSLLVCFQ